MASNYRGTGARSTTRASVEDLKGEGRETVYVPLPDGPDEVEVGNGLTLTAAVPQNYTDGKLVRVSAPLATFGRGERRVGLTPDDVRALGLESEWFTAFLAAADAATEETLEALQAQAAEVDPTLAEAIGASESLTLGEKVRQFRTLTG